MALEQSPRPSRGRFSLRSKPNCSFPALPLPLVAVRFLFACCSSEQEANSKRPRGFSCFCSNEQRASEALPLDGLSSRGLCPNAIEPLDLCSLDFSCWNRELCSSDNNKSKRGAFFERSKGLVGLFSKPALCSSKRGLLEERGACWNKAKRLARREAGPTPQPRRRKRGTEQQATKGKTERNAKQKRREGFARWRESLGYWNSALSL
jgi:hypothetical protein